MGIDPGSRVTGIGVIEKAPSSLRYLAAANIKTEALQMGDRLCEIHQQLCQYFEDYRPEVVAIEAIFMHKNAQSALKLGQARGVAILAARLHQCQVVEYAPRQVKQAVVGYGASDKSQVQHMVRQLLNLATLPPTDAADALAVAVCHAHMNPVLLKLMTET